MLSMKDSLKKCLSEQNITFYQTFTFQNEELNKGIRKNERREFIDLEDIKNKHILDLGCATGAECLWAVEKNALSAIGIDKGDEQINAFNEVIKCVNFEGSIFENKLKAISYDLTEQINENMFSNKIDTIFCFAINQYISYRRIWHEIPCAKVIYVEGGADSGFNESNLTDDLYQAFYLGATPSNANDQNRKRPFFKLIRK
jgi:hypothetical protein